MFKRFAAGLAVLMLLTAGAAAEPLPAATGPVVLTVVGSIGHSNRPPFAWQEDLLFKYHERAFDKAVEFDLAMLEALGMHEVTIRYRGWPQPYRLAGPRLQDVLAAAGAQAQGVAVLALDGFAKEISKEEMNRRPWIVAIKRDGQYLKLGGRGPSWIVYAPADGPEASDEDEQNWPWAVFLIEAR